MHFYHGHASGDLEGEGGGSAHVACCGAVSASSVSPNTRRLYNSGVSDKRFATTCRARRSSRLRGGPVIASLRSAEKGLLARCMFASDFHTLRFGLRMDFPHPEGGICQRLAARVGFRGTWLGFGIEISVAAGSVPLISP